jgi:hypothetical protein
MNGELHELCNTISVRQNNIMLRHGSRALLNIKQKCKPLLSDIQSVTLLTGSIYVCSIIQVKFMGLILFSEL